MEYAIENPMHVQQPLIQMVVDDLNGSGTCTSTGASAARTSLLMETLIKDYYQK